MADDGNDLLAPQGTLDAVVTQLQNDDEAGLTGISRLMQTYPLDPRLHFLQGSVLAGLQRYDDGRKAMARAIEIAPDFALARFQLGFLDLTSGRALDAIGVWQQLGNLPEDAPLRVLAEGLACLAADRFDEARQLLRRGMALNTEHPLINGDMQLILDEIANKTASETPAAVAPLSEEETPVSAVDLLLRQQTLRQSPSKLKH